MSIYNIGIGAPADVFGVARWFDQLLNSTARAVSPAEVEWQCRTPGSGRGRGDWERWALWDVVATFFCLPTATNHAGRDEVIVRVPLEQYGEIATLIERLGEDAGEWPWLWEEDEDRQVATAAEVLGLPAVALADDPELLRALGIE